MKILFKLFILLISGGLFAQESQEFNALQSATSRYVAFINHLGGEVFDAKSASLICSPDLKKIFNGKLSANSRDEFISQLLELKHRQGNWAIHPADILILPESRTVVLRLIIAIEKAGVFTAIVILRYTPDLLIAEINEVFNQFEGMDHEIPKIR